MGCKGSVRIVPSKISESRLAIGFPLKLKQMIQPKPFMPLKTHDKEIRLGIPNL
jgi:hypothetical protein